MLSYDKEQNILTMKSFEDKPIKVNPLEDIIEAYHRYLYGGDDAPYTLKKDLEYFWDVCRVRWSMGDSVGGNYPSVVVEEPANAKNGMVTGNVHYTVVVKLDDGKTTHAFELPYMDSRGVLNRRGSLKVLINYLQAAEDISYDATKQRINIQLGNRNIYLEIAATNFKTVSKTSSGNNTIDFDMLALGLMSYEGISDDVAHSYFELFDNYEITSRLKVEPTTFGSTAASAALPFVFWNLNKNFKCSAETRDNLNRALSLDRAIGEYLADDACDDNGNVILKRGEKLDIAAIKRLKAARVWHIRVVNKPNIIGCKLAEPVAVGYLPKGLHIGSFLRQYVTTIANVKYLPEDIGSKSFDMGSISEDATIVTLDKNAKITPEMYEFIFDYGLHNFINPIVIKSGARTMTIKNYVEVITNRTFWGKDIGKDEQWYAYDREGNLKPQKEIEDIATVCYENQEKDTYLCYNGSAISSFDALALISLAGWYAIYPNHRILGDKDTSLMKKVQLADAVFSKTFRDTINRLENGNSKFFADLQKNMQECGAAGTIHEILSSDYSRLEHEWFTTLEEGKYFETADQINPVAVLAHATNISTFSRGKNSVAESQRLLSLLYYGRICPYETPASGKIGLTNHKALGCKIVDGVMLTPCYEVHNGVIDYSELHYKSAKELELEVVTFPSESNIVTQNGVTRLVGTFMAICPNPSSTGDSTIVKDVSPSDVNYIFASPTMQISTTAALVPFLGSDDPARISFSLSMQKQAIFCQDNQKPRVMTSMYRDLVNILPYYTITAEYDGVVKSIDSNAIRVIYKLPNIGKNKPPEELRTREILMPLEAIGEANLTANDPNSGANRFAEGSTIAVHGDDTYTAPFDCEIIEIHEDYMNSTGNDESYIVVKEVNKLSDAEFIDKPVAIACKDVNTSGPAVTFTNYFIQPGDTFKKGKILARASIFRDGVYAPARNALVAYIPTGYNYEDAVEMSENCAMAYTSISVREESVTVTKYANRPYMVLNSGYIPEGAVVATPHARSLKRTVKLNPVRTQNISGYAYESRAKNAYNGSTNEFGIRLLSFSAEKQGDKMAGRHGNKGVCAHICKNSEMPMFSNGKIVDICLNPCGVPSRMNLGQNLEAHLGFVAELLDIYIVSDAFNGATHEDIRMLVSLVYDLANSDPNRWSGIFDRPEYSALRESKRDILAHITQDSAHIQRITEWAGAFERTGTARLYDPHSQRWYENPISFGYSYFLKLEQEVDEKVHSRAGMTNSEYVDNTQQPVKGRSKGGGQKQGEMELVTLEAHGAVNILHEIMNEKSDNVGERFRITCEAFGLDPENINSNDCTSRANDIIRYYLEAMGVYTDILKSDPHIANIDKYASSQRIDYGVADLKNLAVAQGVNSVATSKGASNNGSNTEASGEIDPLTGLPV